MAIYEDNYEKRFQYVTDKRLRKHMWDAFRHVWELLSLIQNTKLSNDSMFRKTCILYTASLIEANIHYCINKLWYSESESKKEWDYKVQEVCKTELSEWELILCTRKRKKAFLEKADFNLLNSFSCNIANIYDEKIFKEVDYVRKLRNKIHLQSLEDIDRKFTDKQMNRVFDCARDIFKKVEKKLRN